MICLPESFTCKYSLPLCSYDVTYCTAELLLKDVLCFQLPPQLSTSPIFQGTWGLWKEHDPSLHGGAVWLQLWAALPLSLRLSSLFLPTGDFPLGYSKPQAPLSLPPVSRCVMFRSQRLRACLETFTADSGAHSLSLLHSLMFTGSACFHPVLPLSYPSPPHSSLEL